MLTISDQRKVTFFANYAEHHFFMLYLLYVFFPFNLSVNRNLSTFNYATISGFLLRITLKKYCVLRNWLVNCFKRLLHFDLVF